MTAKKSEIPAVIPMTQMAIDADGKTISRRVRPLTYALMSFVKVDLGLEDTIDISEEEDTSQWSYDDVSDDDELSTKIYIDVSEDAGIISLDIYPINLDISSLNHDALKDFILEKNLSFHTGQLQLMNGHLRFHSSIDVEGLASEDPSYEGPHLIHPRLIMNMFSYGRGRIEKVLHNLKTLA